eukprot:TRINITY_DN96827_c0_g1_i1.p1 TRINITY_DN96827_c0_g1~~TRINITY_DN96827_c0_g1_i1.p1  ORF type:complete len:236 (-),score=37.31 TRINITY_DN96827_c0_g1_i1:74-694(-)
MQASLPRLARAALGAIAALGSLMAMSWLAVGALETKGAWQAAPLKSQPALRRLSAACSASGEPCLESKCCADWTETCFQRDTAFARCLNSCTPGGMESNSTHAWTCKTPFEDPRGIARKTELWPDIEAVCSAGLALVRLDAFEDKYRSSCSVFCSEGVGEVVPEASGWWISVDTEPKGETRCPGHKAGNQRSPVGMLCQCSFPDRL